MRRAYWPILGAAAGMILLGGCGDRESGARDELGDAGYSMTGEDYFRAVAAGDAKVLGRFAEGGFDLRTADESGDSALHVAAAAGAEKSLYFLLDRGMSVDLPGAGGRSPLAAAVSAGQAVSVRYLLRQGADPDQRDDEGYKPLMRAVEEGRTEVVEELAPYVRGDLDTAMLMAAVLGKPEMIDALTNYGASVYARTDDGRSGLMLAAEHGHLGAARMLLAIGANRFAVDGEGRTAAEVAESAGHSELAAELRQAPGPAEFGLEEPGMFDSELLAAVDPGEAAGPEATVDGEVTVEQPGEVVEGGAGDTGPNGGIVPRPAGGGAERAAAGGGAAAGRRMAKSIEGATVSGTRDDEGRAMPAIVMRHYREPVLPMRVESVTPGKARVRMLSGGETREIEVSEGAEVPGSRLKVVRIERRIDHSKLEDGRPADVSVVEVEDVESGRRRQLVTGLTATAHDPLALVEDEASGEHFLVEAGDRFRSEDGSEYSVVDVRSNQLVLEHLASGETVTLPLRGPRG